MIQKITADYFKHYPDEVAGLQALRDQLATGEALNDRKNFNGHITGSALVLSPDRQKVLVIYHRLFSKWLQPGGHWEDDEPGPWSAAWREAEEETGVVIDHQEPTFGDDPRIPLDINTHQIMNRPHKHEPAHDHHDFRYVFVARSEALKPKTSEVNISDMAWAAPGDERLAHIKAMITKLQHYHQESWHL